MHLRAQIFFVGLATGFLGSRKCIDALRKCRLTLEPSTGELRGNSTILLNAAGYIMTRCLCCYVIILLWMLILPFLPDISSDDEPLIDVVVVASHDDADVLIKRAMPSIFKHFKELRYVFVVCTAKLCEMLSRWSVSSHLPRHRVFAVPEEEYPFQFSEVKNFREKHGFVLKPGEKNWHGWVFQQLLKLYSHRVLGRCHGFSPLSNQVRPTLLPHAVVTDSDTIWLKPISFMYDWGSWPSGFSRSWYSIASESSGAFTDDAHHGQECAIHLLRKAVMRKQRPHQSCLQLPPDVLQEYTCPGPQETVDLVNKRVDCGHGSQHACIHAKCCWQPTSVMQPGKNSTTYPWCFHPWRVSNIARVHEAVEDGFPEVWHKNDNAKTHDGFTGITHHSLFQARVLEDLLVAIEATHQQSAWQALAITTPYLSEYDLYLTWAATRFPQTAALRTLPYANMGKTSYEVAKGNLQDFAYVTLHDDYAASAKCCVNVLKPQAWDCKPCSDVDEGFAYAGAARLKRCQQLHFPGKILSEKPIRRAEVKECALDNFAKCAHGF
eukprot:TRINITY_DN17768_c0_g1_i2.p1 TRINITY_DN17768_c0_g1~~TRINITY_DN17768_c0_g1_i2.p1  ORF type:complete len:550 (-),score=57.93 TRINITY_DN17768_c0_g1_i2:44-1693(-)